MKKSVFVLMLIALLSTSVFAEEKITRCSYSGGKEEFCDSLTDVLLELSFYNNVFASFDKYPYATRNNYIELNADITAPQWYRFTLSTDASYQPQYNSLGTGFRLEGFVWKFLGPVFENQYVASFDNTVQQGYMNLGMEFAIFQLSLCTFIFDAKWEHLYGDEYADGFNFGFGLRSYPFKPMLFEARADWGNFKHSDSSYNSKGIRRDATFHARVEAGCMLNCPVELYGFWDYLMDGFLEQKQNSLGIGVKYQF